MSSDYIPRLRSELLRAGARDQARSPVRRAARTVRPRAGAVAVVAVAVVAVVAVLVLAGGGNDEQAAAPPGRAYRVEPPGAAEPAAAVLRARLADAGVTGAHVTVAAGGALTVAAPAAADADVAALTQPGRIAVYDWERSVLGPRGAPAPDDASVTGGADAGHAAALPEADAKARAAALPGGHAVRALGDGGNRWFALGGDPALANTDIARADATVDPVTQEPVVSVELTPGGRSAFTALTREVALRGGAGTADGVSDIDAAQHIAIVLDDRIVSVPYVQQPQDGRDVLQIAGGLTTEAARRVASMLTAGPLPATLEPADGG